MNMEKMGGSVTYAKYITLTSKNYTLAPLKDMYKSVIDYYAIDGAEIGETTFFIIVL